LKNNRDYSTIIIWSALLVTVARYVGAFLASDLGMVEGWISDALTILMGLSGMGMGFLDVLGLAYVFDGWRKTLPRTGDKWTSRFLVLTFFVVSLFIVGVSILIPFTVSRIRAEGMEQVLGQADWYWAFAVNIAPYLLIGGVTFSQTGFISVKNGENASISTDQNLPKNVCKHCQERFNTLQDLATHVRWKHPKNKRKTIVVEDVPEENKNGKVVVTETTNHNDNHPS
jgi:MFS family permease